MVRAAALNYLAEQALLKLAPILEALAEKKPAQPVSSLQLVQESMERLQPRDGQPAPEIPIHTTITHEVIGGRSELPKLRLGEVRDLYD